MINMIRIAIIDDEENCRVVLRETIKQFAQDCIIVIDTYDANHAFELITKGGIIPDLVFLDIQMPGCNGFEFLKRFTEIPFTIVFTTAYDQYAIKAIKYAALDYLLKPIDQDELIESIARYKQLKKPLNLTLLNHFKQQLSSNSQFDFLAVPSLTEIVFIPIDDILYLKSDNNYTQIVLNHQQVISSRNLGYYEEILKGHHFFRIHNSFLINLKKLKKYVRGKTGYAEMQDGTCITISARRKEEFLDLLKLN